MLPSRPDCPECGEPLAKPYSSCTCGWRATKSSGSPYKHSVRIGDQWIDKGCAWNDHGDKCPSYGHMSIGTTGTGPWYCRDHFADLMRWPRYVVDDNLEILREAA